MRRDFEKYLSLIATITLLHQYQREHHEVREEHEGYVVATLDDIALANRLAGEALGQSLDDLLPQTRQLLVLIDDLITKRSQLSAPESHRIENAVGENQLGTGVNRLLVEDSDTLFAKPRVKVTDVFEIRRGLSAVCVDYLALLIAQWNDEAAV